MDNRGKILLAVLAVSLAGCGGKTTPAQKNKKLLDAVHAGDAPAVRSLLGRGADPNARDDQGWTPLLLSIKDHPELATVLIDGGADVNGRVDLRRRAGRVVLQDSSDFGASALQLAIHHRPELVGLLLERGADVNLPGQSGITPLQAAVEAGRAEMVKDLLARGSKINARNDLDYTALHFAAISPAAEITQMLLERGAEVDARTSTKHGGGETALHFAAWIGHEKIVRLLVDAKADVNAVDGRGRTPLHCAAGGTTVADANSPEGKRLEVREAHLQIARLLLETDAKINIEDRTGRTPLDYATKAAAEENAGKVPSQMVELLKGKGARAGAGQPKAPANRS